MSIQSVIRDNGWLSVNYTDGLTQKYLASWLRDNIDTGRHLSHGQCIIDLNLMDRVSITDDI